MALSMDQAIPGLKSFVRGTQKGLSCGEVIKCVLDITDEGWNIYHFIDRNGPVRVDRIGELLGKDRSTAYRELQKLCNCGICHKEPANLKEGGYYFLYHARSMEEIKRETEQCIDATYRKLKEAINDTFTPRSEG